MLVKEKMKPNRYLITVTSDEIKKLKVNCINFLFPIQDYSVGYLKTYRIDEITTPNAFISINRILDESAITGLEQDLKQLPSNIIGICFTDLGVLQLVKKLNLSLKLIYMQNHNTTNYLSINYYLEEVDSVLISTDITKEEILSILDKASKPLVIPYFMLVDVMYSRRKLLSNFQEEFSLKTNKEMLLHEPISQNDFLAVENDFGTILYDKKFIDYRDINHEQILYRYINPVGLTKEQVEKILLGCDTDVLTSEGFLHRKTYYRLKEEK